ncbi:MAG: hypothetical protein AB7O59_14675 [Pirellulales bacterium]
MNRSSRLAFVMFLCAVGSVGLNGADVSVAPWRGVLLLNNGQLISGTVTAAGDRYDVHLDDGQISVRAAQVALVARNVRECYEFKRSQIQVERAADYLDLAEWCLRNLLFDEAAKEIAAAKRIDSTHPKVPLLDTRLRLARDRAAAAAAKASAVTPASATSAVPGDSAPAVLPAGAADANQLPAPDAAIAKKPLDLVVRNLPHGTVETFTNGIQPLLLNYCARAGCHGSQSTTAMRLERIPPNRYTGRKSTQRNLQSVLAMIDREQPLHSKLLTAPAQPHGKDNVVIFTDRRQSQYRQLVQWVYQVVGNPPAPQPMPVAPDDRTAPLLERGPKELPTAAAEPTEQAPATSALEGPAADGAPAAQSPTEGAAEGATTDVAPDDASPAAGTGDGTTSGPDDPTQAQGANAGSAPAPHGPANVHAQPLAPAEQGDYVPRDPFDPEIFNRRYLHR